MYREMKIYGFTIDNLAEQPVVILRDAADGNSIPVWMSSAEAVAIAAELLSRDAARLSGRNELHAALLEKLGLKVAMVAIDGLNDGRFSASVSFKGDGQEIRIDVRPAEALVTALSNSLPVMVAEAVIEQASSQAMSDEGIAQETAARRFAAYLDKLDPSALGKYPM